MPKSLKPFLKFLLAIAGLVLILTFISVATIMLTPSFGQPPAKAREKVFEQTGHYANGQFQNLIETRMDMNWSKFISISRDYLKGVKGNAPQSPLPVIKTTIPKENISEGFIWFGHSAFFLRVGSKNLLIDPMFGDAAAPLPFLGARRFSDGLPVAIEDLPKIDVLLLSHDHYDHLDYPSIKALKPKVKRYLVPLGLGSHLRSWGVEESKIVEMDWWEDTMEDNIKFTCTPARHFSGRALNDRNKTLWSSWAITTDSLNLYFSGDGGYGPHFKTIGERLGPFDFAMMECGQYDKRWSQIHMMPEETAMAAVDIGASHFMPIHWGAFVLALHAWDDPVIRVSKKAEELNLKVITPQIGETVALPALEGTSDWWKIVE
jgi:L-ascorbate metabolism protein UlaG (beta-lactamase superfamily)